MSKENQPMRSDPDPVATPNQKIPADDGCAATMPLDSSTAPARSSGETVSLDSVIPGTAVHTNDSNSSNAITNQLSNFPATLDTPSGAEVALAEVRGKVQRKAAAILRTQVGDYEIEHELGRGGMGVVYKARHRQLKRDVALKMILHGGHAGPEQLERFLAEARAVAQLQHPNIVQIFDIGEHDGLPYFSLEYVDGHSLAQQLNKEPQTPEHAGSTLELLARAMQYAHDHGVLHRDLKPANVLMTKEGVPKITDFGLAKKVDDNEAASTRTGTVMGTPSYMSPEQAMGLTHEVGPAADQYSLGAILYEMLTGRPPFLAAKAVDTILQVIQNEPIAPRQLQPSIPVDLETICLKALQKEPSKRYASCLELAEDARRFREGLPILARPVSGSERFFRWCRRNPRIASLSAAVALLLLAVAGTSTFAYFRIAMEQGQTLKERQAAIEARDSAQQSARQAEEARKIADERAQSEKVARKLAEQKETEARVAEERAAKSAKIADEQRNLALAALRSLVTSVQDKLKDREDMRVLQKELLDVAMTGLAQVAGSAEKADLVDRSIGNAHQRMGDLFRQTGRTEDALKQYELAQQIFRKLATENPEATESEVARYNLAVMHEKIGDIKQQLGDTEATHANYLEALALRQMLHDNLEQGKIKSPELKPIIVQMARATSLAKLGSLSLLLGNPRGAQEYYAEALQMREKIAAENPGNVAAMHALASSYFTLGDTAFRLHDVQAARDYHQNALKLRKAFAENNPQSVSAKQDLAASYGAIGDVELQARNRQLALKVYAQAHEIHTLLAAADPNSTEAQFGLSQSFYRLGSVNALLGNDVESMSQFRESLAIRESMLAADPKNIHRQVEVMLVRARCGDHPGANQMSDAVLAAAPNDPAMLYYVGCGKALCAAAIAQRKEAQSLSDSEKEQQDSYAAQAVAILRQAVERGFGDVVSLESDPDLSFLQDRPDFRRLIAGITQR